MTQPTPDNIRSVQRASADMADRNTPFVYDEWYVAAFNDEINRSLLARTILGKRVVFYRTESGEPIALADRCAHRSLPLSGGKLEGDGIVCGYHGFRYNSRGDCVEVPSMAKCPRSIGVHRYPLVEYGGLIWIWMGGPTQPERGPPPAIDFVASPAWDRSKGYFLLPGNYVSLHENLLDLTHLSFVHANSFGTPDYAAAPYRSEIHDGHFLIRREVIPTRLPPVWAEPTGLTDLDTAARIATSEFFSPGFHQVTTRFYDNALPETARPVFTIKTAHLPTPETHASTHYFIVHGRDFARNDDRVTQTMHDRLFAAFQEDVEALSLLEGALEHTPAEELYEISVPSDAPSVAMRRYLRKRAMGAERPSANV